jgi:hypothetical protein
MNAFAIGTAVVVIGAFLTCPFNDLCFGVADDVTTTLRKGASKKTTAKDGVGPALIPFAK